MGTARAKDVVFILWFAASVAAVCCNNALLNLLTEVEDLRERTSQLKTGQRRFAAEMGTFIEAVRSIKFNAKYLEAGASIIYWEQYQRLSDRLRFKMNVNSRETPRNRLYSSAALEGLDHFRRIFLYKVARRNMDNQGAQTSCHIINLYVQQSLQDKIITMNHVCTSLHSCGKVARPYEILEESSGDEANHRSREDEDLTIACTDEHECNVEKALPLMTGLFYSKVYEVASSYECCRRLSEEKDCERYARTKEELKNEAEVLLAYAYSHPQFWNTHWGTFFSDAILNNAHLDIDVAVSMIDEKKYDFEILGVVCRVLQFAQACPYDDIYKQYLIIKKSQQSRNNPMYVKDLRLYQHIDHAKLVELQKIKLAHIETLGSVRNLDENLQASVSGISAYFGELAKFDQGIADADAAFVSGELEKYTSALSQVQEKLNEDLHEAMSYMIAVLSARLAEKITVLGMKIFTNTNPLKLLFTGPDISDIAALANEVADAGADLAKGATLLVSVSELAFDSEKFADAFIGNGKQLSAVESLKNQIVAGQSNNLNEEAGHFLEQYAAYTPQTDRSSLAKNDALWSAFKDATCDLLFTDSGVASAIPKGIAGAKLLCERLEGTLAQFFTLREDIFDFQFQLIDAMAGIIRGNFARRLSENIKGNGDIISGAQLLTMFFLSQSDLQTVASTFCNVVEYKHLGQPFSGCATFGGLFRKENLDAIIAYNPRSVTYHGVDRFATVPTRPAFPGDKAYIDLNALAKGHEVLFQVPKNRTWLNDNRWTISGQRETEVPFVKAFEIYLPQKSYESHSIPTSSTMEITIKSVASSYVSMLNPNTGIAYLLPRASATYLTSYEENYSSCSKEIKNPYSLCNNLPNLCSLSSRHPQGDALLPTILSTWSIRLRRSQGSRKLTWDAPHASTNLSLSAKLVLQAPSSLQKKKTSLKHMARSVIINTENGCCEDNRYRVNRMLNRECAICPAGSTARLRGLYCEIDQPSETHVKKLHSIRRGRSH